MSMWEMCNNMQDISHRKKNIPKLHRKKELKGCSCTVVVQVSTGRKKILSKFFLEDPFPSIGNFKVFKELRVSQSQQCAVHICPSTGSLSYHTPDFQLWLSKDIEIHLYLDHK